MSRTLRKLALLPVLLLAVTACDGPGEQAARPLPTSPDPLLGALLGGNEVQGYTLVKDPILSLGGISNSLRNGTVISFAGGKVELLGHTLVVPPGAVTQPTLFSIIVLPTGYVEVDLLATVNTLFGVLDTGSKGFAKPIPVSLTYSRATNVTDPSGLTILRINSLLGYGRYEVMPSQVDTVTKQVSTRLDHFSRYTMAYPD